MSEMFSPQFRKEAVVSAEDKKADELQQKLLDVMNPTDTKKKKKKNAKKRGAVKREYVEAYPDQLEGIEIIFGIKKFLELQKHIESQTRENSDWEETKKILRELTEYQFLITHYLLEAGDKPGGRSSLNKFWRLGEKIAQGSNSLGEFLAIKKGILGQVASYRILRELGHSPKLPHPNLDAFFSVDLLTQESMAVQVKSHFAKEPVLLGIEQVEEIGVPATIINHGGQEVFINEKHSEALRKFKINLQKLSRQTHQSYRGYEFIIPINMIDENTGAPIEKIVQYFKNELERRLGKQPSAASA